MKDAPDFESQRHLVIYNDDETPYGFVTQLLVDVLARSEEDANAIAREISSNGSKAIGPLPGNVAEAAKAEADRRSAEKGHPLKVEVKSAHGQDADKSFVCSFCGKSKDSVKYLFAGQTGNICDECLLRAAPTLSVELENQAFTFIHELLRWHFGGVGADQIVTTSRSYPARVRADLQSALESELDAASIKTVGLYVPYSHEKVDFPALLETGRNAKKIAPLQFEEIDIGEGEPKRCLANAVWLIERDGARMAVLLSNHENRFGGLAKVVEVASLGGDVAQAVSQQLFAELDGAIREASSYRGKVLSLEQRYAYTGESSGITVHRLGAVERSEIILPEDTLDLIDRSIIGFARQRDQLRKRGQSTKRGVLFHGAPGTGKTHTIRYLASKMPDHTTLLMTAEQAGLIGEYFSLARLLQPTIMVIEDVDLIARSREAMNSECEEALLNRLLNEMDGLQEDADILFLLTTNRAGVLEDALANRPGRVDQAIEFPMPDAECRRRLVDLYGGELRIPDNVRDSVVSRTDGVSAAFIKELARRSLQFAIEDTGDDHVMEPHVNEALEDMLFSTSGLNSKILGASKN